MNEETKHGIFIIDFQGFKIYYGHKKFTAIKGDIELKANTETELQVIIKKHAREKRKFRPINVIKVEDEKLGRITSRAADNDSLVWFSHKEGEHPKHTQERLESYSWSYETRKNIFVEATGKNLIILGEITELQLKIDTLNKEIIAKRKTYEQPVTWELIDKQAGES